MAIDLYRDDFSTLTDQEAYRAIETFARIAEPPDVRPSESFVLDFKEEWNDRALHSVAGFAHTFGGLLIVGVSETKDAKPNELIGVECRGELKTKIASSIATNISPTPSYQIAECGLPSNPRRRFAVVRVRQGNQLYYLTKKDEQPIYVRNETESRPANAAQLRALIEQKAQASQLESSVASRLETLRNSVRLTKTALGTALNPTDLQICLVPFNFRF